MTENRDLKITIFLLVAGCIFMSWHSFKLERELKAVDHSIEWFDKEAGVVKLYDKHYKLRSFSFGTEDVIYLKEVAVKTIDGVPNNPNLGMTIEQVGGGRRLDCPKCKSKNGPWMITYIFEKIRASCGGCKNTFYIRGGP